jgi:hypothetical protein
MRQMWFRGKLPAADVDCPQLRARPAGVDATDLRLTRGNYAGKRCGEFPRPKPVMQSGMPQPRQARLSNAETGQPTASFWSPQEKPSRKNPQETPSRLPQASPSSPFAPSADRWS